MPSSPGRHFITQKCRPGGVVTYLFRSNPCIVCHCHRDRGHLVLELLSCSIHNMSTLDLPPFSFLPKIVSNACHYISIFLCGAAGRLQLPPPEEGLAHPNLMKSCFTSQMIVHIIMPPFRARYESIRNPPCQLLLESKTA